VARAKPRAKVPVVLVIPILFAAAIQPTPFWLRPASSIVSISAAVIATEFIFTGSMSYAHAANIVLIAVACVGVLWGGAALWQQ
jgi:hypothetical protein